MSEDQPNVARRLLGVAAEIIVGIFLVFDGLISPLFGPPMRWLSSLRLIQRLEGAVAGLPPYVILILLVVPFGFAELAKVYAVLLMAEEHLRTGLTIFIGAYVVSILICERTFHAGKGQLMTIGWFKMFYDWIMAIRERVLGWFRQTRVWRAGADMRVKARLATRRTRMRLQLVGAKPKRSAELR